MEEQRRLLQTMGMETENNNHTDREQKQRAEKRIWRKKEKWKPKEV